MEEQNKTSEFSEENKEDISETSDNTQNTTSKGMPNRSCGLMLIAGAYLVYTGYRLCKNVIDGVDGGGVGFFVAGVGFIVVGGVMLIIGWKNIIKNKKDDQAVESDDVQNEQNDSEADEAEPKKPMSIAERARLTDAIKEDEEDE